MPNQMVEQASRINSEAKAFQRDLNYRSTQKSTLSDDIVFFADCWIGLNLQVEEIDGMKPPVTWQTKVFASWGSFVAFNVCSRKSIIGNASLT